MIASNSYRSPLTVAVAIALSALAYPALSQTAMAPAAKVATNAATNAKPTPQDREMLKLSQDGFAAMRAVRSARVAIFNGDPQGARDLLAKAKASLAVASAEAPVYVTDVKTGVKGKIVDEAKMVDRVDLIPIDGQLVLSDDFVATPEKKTHIDKANEHFAKGRAKEATEELRLAEVDSSFTRVLMPLAATTRHVTDATRLVGEQKYYEANLVLKAAEDGLRLDTVTLSEVPKVAAAAAKGAPIKQ